MTQPDASLVDRLSATIDDVLEPLLPRGSRCALLDFPNHSNVGDSAIWLGEVEWLRRHDVEIVYSCDTSTYSRSQLRERIGSDPILLHGGGNLGDLWIEHQDFREQVIQHFPDNSIIQLPQTIHFFDEWRSTSAAKVFNSHKRLTVLCRDHHSLDFARTSFTCHSALCPDLALALGPLSREASPEEPLLWLCRSDAESRVTVPATVAQIDWLAEPTTPLIVHNRELSERSGVNTTLDDLIATYEPLSRARLQRGCQLLCRGKFVVTDRLHGHILCLLLGIPHVLLDNSYGKNRAFYDAWTHNCALAHWAESPDEAMTIANSRLQECEFVA